MRRALWIVLTACHAGRAPSTLESHAITPPSSRANPPPFPALRVGSPAPATRIAPGIAGAAGTCTIEPRTAAGAARVTRQLVIRCDGAHAVTLAAGGGDVVITQAAPRGNSAIRIDRGGRPVVDAAVRDARVRFEHGEFRFGVALPEHAPDLPAGWNVIYRDDTSILVYDQAFQLRRGTIEGLGATAAWKLEPLAASWTPAKGVMLWPVFLPHASGDPTTVYVGDSQLNFDVIVREPDGERVVLPTWPGAPPDEARIDALSAVALDAERDPVVTAKVADSIIVAYPSAAGYTMRGLAGTSPFSALPAAPAPAIPTPSDTGPRCSESTTTRDSDEVFAPRLFAWHGAGLAFLANRVRETLRWTAVPIGGATPHDDRVICDWVVDRRTSSHELVVMHLDASGGHEALRVPVEFSPMTDVHGPSLLVSSDGAVLDAVASSSGITTYTRVALP